MAEWTERAACRGVAVDVFFRAGGCGCNREAIALCADCAVRVECLEAALEVEHQARSERFGIRGGLTADQRHDLMRERRGWAQVERSWRDWRLCRDRVELHRTEWAVFERSA